MHDKPQLPFATTSVRLLFSSLLRKASTRTLEIQGWYYSSQLHRESWGKRNERRAFASIRPGYLLYIEPMKIFTPALLRRITSYCRGADQHRQNVQPYGDATDNLRCYVAMVVTVRVSHAHHQFAPVPWCQRRPKPMPLTSHSQTILFSCLNPDKPH